jgi:hypothetical protein
MPSRRGRSTPKKPLTLGFLGSAELDPKAVAAQLDDLITEDTEVDLLVVPVTKDTYTDGIAAVVAWCTEYEIPFSTLSDADANKDRSLKKVIALAGEGNDYDADEYPSMHEAMLDFLTSSEDQEVADGRLILFLDADSEDDVAIAEAADEADVACYNIVEGLSLVSFEDDGQPEEPKPVEEPTRRGRGRAAAAAEPQEEKGDYTAVEKRRHTNLLKLGLTELKRKLKDVDKSVTTDSLKGTDKEFVADAIILAERATKEDQLPLDGDDGDEAQQPAAPTRRGRAAKAAEPGDEPVEDEDAEDPKEAVFARLRSSREAAEQISQNLVVSLKAIAEEGDQDQVLERASAALAVSMMLFAEHIITEVRKPKSAGRPRKDGSEAQPRDTEDEPKKATPRRRRAS